MKTATQYRIILVTAPDLKVARQLARAILRPRAAACVNIISGLESHYWWKGKLESGAEALLVIKTVKKNLPRLEKIVVKNHPYDTPEIVVLPLSGGNGRYLNWLAGAVV